MGRLFGLRTLLIFLLAIGTNCAQASQVMLDPVPSEVAAAVNASDPTQENASEFMIADDDSDDVPNVPVLDSKADPTFAPDSSLFLYYLIYLTPISFPQHTILQI